jgi:putative DNA primase/helicase
MIDAAAFPDVDTTQESKAKGNKARTAAHRAPADYQQSRTKTTERGLERLAELCQQIRTIPVGSRPPEIFRLSCAVGRLIAHEQVSPTDAKAAITEAIGGDPLEDRHERSMRSGLQQGYAELREKLKAALLPATDVGNGWRFVHRYGAEVRYCPPRRKWLVWDGKRWAWDEKKRVVELAKATVAHIREEAWAFDDEQDKTHEAKRKALLAHAHASEAAGRIKAMLEMASSDPAIVVLPKELDADPWLFNCANGTINLRTGKLQPHAQADQITMLSPVAYDENVPAGPWAAFLDHIVNKPHLANNVLTAEAYAKHPSVELADYLQCIAGYCLTGLQTEKLFFFFFGAPNCGKSTWLDALRAAMGEYAGVADSSTWLVHTHTGGNRGDIVDLLGKRLVTTSEFEPGRRFNEKLIKNITGGDPVKYAAKYEAEVEYFPQYKLGFGANIAPEIRHKDDGMWDRCRRIPFTRVIEKRNPKMKIRLCDPQDVGPEILAWAVQGCLAWQKHGLVTPKVVEESTAAYRADMNQVSKFVAECCKLDPDPKTRVKKSELRDAFDAWRKDNGIAEATKATEFSDTLRSPPPTGFELSEVKDSVWYWVGIRLRQADEFEDIESAAKDVRRQAHDAKFLRDMSRSVEGRRAKPS